MRADAASNFSGRGTPRRYHLACAVEARPAELREALQAHPGFLEERASLLEQVDAALRSQPAREPPFAERMDGATPCAACGEPIDPGDLAIAIDDGAPHLHLGCARRAGLGDLDEALIRTHSRGLAPGDLDRVAQALRGPG